ncbi:hypothetical protein GCM10020000_19210 [Streptomyces olivoverticillatus]
MEWNLLLGGEHPHPERLGYTWIEFGRRDGATGEVHFRTLVCGLKAVTGRGIARHWYAVTDRRIGRDLSLLDATRTALSRDRLAEAIAGHGMVYDQAKTYRRAVDEALFGLGEQRYAALVDLLIQLRQPQLSKRPNEAALSRALTEALPPMDQAVVADAAEAFRSLDEEKEELRAAAEAEHAASAFLDHYRRYACIASRRRARLPRSEHSRYEHLQRDLAEAQGHKARAEEDRAAAEERIAVLEETETRLRAQDAALRAGPEMRNARELEQVAAEADRTARERERAEADHGQATRLHQRALERLGAADNRLASARHQACTTLAQVREAAGKALVALPDEPTRDAVEEATDRRRRALTHVEGLAERADRTADERRAASRRLDEAESDLALAADTQHQAEAAAAAADRALLDAVRRHAEECRELAYPDPVGLLDELQEWTQHLDGPCPARTRASRAHRAASARLADHAARPDAPQGRTPVARTGSGAGAGRARSRRPARTEGPVHPHSGTAGARNRLPPVAARRLPGRTRQRRTRRPGSGPGGVRAAGRLGAPGRHGPRRRRARRAARATDRARIRAVPGRCAAPCRGPRRRAGRSSR